MLLSFLTDPEFHGLCLAVIALAVAVIAAHLVMHH
jgi:hypothetical protein